ncbi:hypothetical protein GCWU000325_02846 [Alloprevotella tannerae ATCC 51259]|uniref:Uncharacterized protein n=1 Tax=Alloprevotella tannerae ATCC 51259 TaxID=626522 RepID=C9LKS6_9BACT|nr:hypothetical protein GCWU000325_02846 [Alloprevotella tannerae ATCC 51259]
MILILPHRSFIYKYLVWAEPSPTYSLRRHCRIYRFGRCAYCSIYL